MTPDYYCWDHVLAIYVLADIMYEKYAVQQQRYRVQMLIDKSHHLAQKRTYDSGDKVYFYLIHKFTLSMKYIFFYMYVNQVNNILQGKYGIQGTCYMLLNLCLFLFSCMLRTKVERTKLGLLSFVFSDKDYLNSNYSNKIN